MSSSGLLVRRIRKKELETVASWAIAEGWSLDKEGLEIFLEVHSDGFLGAEMDGNLAGCVLAARFGPNYKYGSLGVLIVDKKYRGKGIGKALIKAANKFLCIEREDVTAALSGVKDVAHIYAQYGYKNIVWNILVFEGPICLDRLKLHNNQGIKLVPGSSEQLEKIVNYDKGIHAGIDRFSYWKLLLQQPDSPFLVALDGENVVGFAALRPFREDCQHLGPVYADSIDIAKLLTKSLLEKASAENIEIESIEPNRYLMDLINWLGIQVNYSLVRQYTGTEVPLAYDKVYGTAETDLYFA